MAEHEIYFDQFPRLDIQYADVGFEVRSDGDLLGYLGISKGTLSWTPKNGKRKHISWEELNDLSEDWVEW